MAERLLHDHPLDLQQGVTLLPRSGGIFEVSLGDELIFSKKELDRFPEEGEVEAIVAERLGAAA